MSEEPSSLQGAGWEERAIATPGGRLRLESVTREHAVEMVEVLKDPSLNEHIGERPPSLEYLTTRYEALSSRRSPAGDELWFNWIIRLNAEGLAVGYVQATVREGSAALAWVVGGAVARSRHCHRGRCDDDRHPARSAGGHQLLGVDRPQ
ncbi:hypothetical protein BH20ACT21_BH20ACT21_19400 [soil metagenome]